jgi:hypothetical protein
MTRYADSLPFLCVLDMTIARQKVEGQAKKPSMLRKIDSLYDKCSGTVVSYEKEEKVAI